MSASTCLVFYGLRFEVAKAQIEPLEKRSHPTLRAARRVGLKHYWGNFGAPGDRYLLFVGANLGLLGIENSLEIRHTESDLKILIEEAKAKLKDSGLSGEPALYAQLIPDA